MDDRITTPSIFIQSVLNANPGEEGTMLHTDERYQDLYVSPDKSFRQDLIKHGVKKLVISDSHVAMLTGMLRWHCFGS